VRGKLATLNCAAVDQRAIWRLARLQEAGETGDIQPVEGCTEDGKGEERGVGGWEVCRGRLGVLLIISKNRTV
jgi:hypothetical protein